MSQPQTLSKTINRRQMLVGTTAASAAVATGITFGLPGSAAAAVQVAQPAIDGTGLASHALCKAHHKELSEHLGRMLNTSYANDRMANRALTTTHCPHCQVRIAPNMKAHAAFAAMV